MRHIFLAILFLITAALPAIAGFETGLPYQVLRVPSTGGRPIYGSVSLNQSAAVTGTLAHGNGGTDATTLAGAFNNLTPMTTLGDIEYESATNVASRLAGNTTSTKKFLIQTGTGSVSAAPSWGTIVAADVSGAPTSSGSAEKINRVNVNTCSADPCTSSIIGQSGSWVSSINWNSTGSYTINITGGTWSANPTCVCSTNTTLRTCVISVNSSTLNVITTDPRGVGTQEDHAFNVICMGPQ